MVDESLCGSPKPARIAAKAAVFRLFLALVGRGGAGAATAVDTIDAPMGGEACAQTFNGVPN